MAKAKSPRYATAKEIDVATRVLFSGQGFVCLSQVRNGTGFERRQVRTADMMAISTWPSRGLYAVGIEIKVNASDLSKELATPSKADDIAKYCRRWFLATQEGLVANAIVPEPWGLIEVDDKGKAKIIKAAKDLEPVPMDTLFACSLIRNFAESHIHRDEVEEHVKSESEALIQRRTAENAHRLEQFESLKIAIQSWEKDHGLQILGYGSLKYDAKKIGTLVRMLMNLRERPAEQLKNAGDALVAASRAIAALTDVPGPELIADGRRANG
ncbi:MAG: MmcB family DNA repair protein [Acidobacteriota bacterium]|nr:MmcB family DNA repair protein [Acidobacteriota bacterium]